MEVLLWIVGIVFGFAIYAFIAAFTINCWFAYFKEHEKKLQPTTPEEEIKKVVDELSGPSYDEGCVGCLAITAGIFWPIGLPFFFGEILYNKWFHTNGADE